MSNEEQRKEVVRYWWSKVEESLASAQREFEARSYDFAINRLYYAVFYAVSAALLERRLSFKSIQESEQLSIRNLSNGLTGCEMGKVLRSTL